MKLIDRAIQNAADTATERVMMKTREELKADFETLKKRVSDDPVTMILVGAAALTAAAKFIDALSAAQGRRAYAKQVKYSTRRRYL